MDQLLIQKLRDNILPRNQQQQATTISSNNINNQHQLEYNQTGNQASQRTSMSSQRTRQRIN